MHSLAVENTNRDSLGQRKKDSKHGKTHELLSSTERRTRQDSERKGGKRGALTPCQAQSRGTRQESERKPASDGDSPPVEHRRGRSGQRKKISKRGHSLAVKHREGLVRKAKQTQRAMEAHHLQNADRSTCQESERKQVSKVHSHPVEHGKRDSSE
jgi:hypothetical protein